MIAKLPAAAASELLEDSPVLAIHPGDPVSASTSSTRSCSKLRAQLAFQLQLLPCALRIQRASPIRAAQYVQHLQGLPMYEPRRPMMSVTEDQKRAIKAAMQPLLG